MKASEVIQGLIERPLPLARPGRIEPAGFLEGEPAAGDSRAFVQWKGTDVCMDFHCSCGEHNHYDGMFAYIIRCGGCGKEWEMPCNLYPRANTRHDGMSVMEPQPDG